MAPILDLALNLGHREPATASRSAPRSNQALLASQKKCAERAAVCPGNRQDGIRNNANVEEEGHDTS